MIHFTDRRNAGQRLAMALGHLSGRDLVVVGLAPGGVVVAEEVAHALDAPLELKPMSPRSNLEAAMRGRVLGELGRWTKAFADFEAAAAGRSGTSRHRSTRTS